MNSIRIQLLRLVDCEETFGFITKEHRQLIGLPKEHYADAIAIACRGNKVIYQTLNVIYKKCVSKGDFQQFKGIRSEQRIPTNKIQGFRKFDKVRYRGEDCFIMGRMSSGFAILMDIKGKKVDFKNALKGMKTPKMVNMKRKGARKSWMISELAIQNIC